MCTVLRARVLLAFCAWLPLLMRVRMRGADEMATVRCGQVCMCVMRLPP